MKSYDHLNLSSGSIIQFRASRYIMRLNVDMRDERWRPRRGEPRPNVDEFKITELPEFNGSADPEVYLCLLYTSPSPRDLSTSRMPSSA